MAISDKIIESPTLLGITMAHDDHRYDATMRSTGRVALREDFPEDDVRSWYVEYKCDDCGELIDVYSPDTHDLVRQLLLEKGILKV